MLKKSLALILIAIMIMVCALAESRLADGSYTPDNFSWSGGSGRLKGIECSNITVRNGETFADIVILSDKYSYIAVNGVHYTCEHADSRSTVEIPIILNADNIVSACTTAMGNPHEIEYTLHVDLAAAGSAANEQRTNDTAEIDLEAFAAERETGTEPIVSDISFNDLKLIDRMETKFTSVFSVDRYEGGYQMIRVKDGQTVLIVPENAGIPANVPGDVLVLRQPLDTIYMASTAAMSLFDSMGGLDHIRYSSQTSDHWYVENASKAMDEGRILFAGKYSEPDYEALLSGNCDLAVENTMILHSPKVQEMLEMLGIPVFIDRSSYEEHPLGKVEWIKLYGAMLGLDEKANAYFEQQVLEVERFAAHENTGLSVAFFYINDDETVSVRGNNDYIPEMIRLAGGQYCFSDISEVNGDAPSITMSMEQFYAYACDADVIIYNGTVEGVSCIDELLKKSILLSDFSAVKNGNVWATGKNFFQSTHAIGTIIADIHRALTNSGEPTTYLTHLN